MQWIALKGISSLNTLPTPVCPPPLEPLQTLRPAVQCLDDPSGGQGGREGPQKSFLIRKMQVSIAVPRLPHPFFVFARTRARSSPARRSAGGIRFLSLSLLWSAVIRKPLHGHPPRDQWDSGHVTGAQEDIPDVFRAWEYLRSP